MKMILMVKFFVSKLLAMLLSFHTSFEIKEM
jgi:hypothetical protein